MSNAGWIGITISLAAAAAGWGRWMAQRKQNQILRQQLDVAQRQLESSQPRPSIKLGELRRTGGAEGYVGFSATLQNVGTAPTTAVVAASVADQQVEVLPGSDLDLLVNQAPRSFDIRVPRPGLGNLVPPIPDLTTLYGATLSVMVVVDGEVVATADWHEHVYAFEENPALHEIQQREWRIGKGEATADDDEADLRAEHLRK